jgi:hypothetical protein
MAVSGLLRAARTSAVARAGQARAAVGRVAAGGGNKRASALKAVETMRQRGTGIFKKASRSTTARIARGTGNVARGGAQAALSVAQNTVGRKLVAKGYGKKGSALQSRGAKNDAKSTRNIRKGITQTVRAARLSGHKVANIGGEIRKAQTAERIHAASKQKLGDKLHRNLR